MKVLILSDYFYPHWTGIVKSVLRLAKILVDNKIKVTVLTVKDKKNLKEKEFLGKIEILRVNYLFKISRVFYSPLIIIKLLMLIKNYDLIFINSPNSNIFFLTLIGKLWRKPVFIFHQGDLILPRQTGNIFLSFFIEKIFDFLTISSFFLADKIGTFTKDYALKSRVMKFFPKKFFFLIPPIIFFNHKNGNKKYKEMAEDLKLLKKKYLLLGFAGRFVEEKGFDILIKAIPLITKKIKNIKFIFAGETNIFYEKFFEKVKSLVEENKNYLIFLGKLHDQQLKIFYQNLDLFILPSKSDCFSLVQIEAMNYKVPVIVSNIPGARYLVKKTGFGLIFQKENEKDLAKKIVFALKNKDNLLKNYKNFKSLIDKETKDEEILKVFRV